MDPSYLSLVYAYFYNTNEQSLTSRVGTNLGLVFQCSADERFAGFELVYQGESALALQFEDSHNEKIGRSVKDQPQSGALKADGVGLGLRQHQIIV